MVDANKSYLSPPLAATSSIYIGRHADRGIYGHFRNLGHRVPHGAKETSLGTLGTFYSVLVAASGGSSEDETRFLRFIHSIPPVIVE